jgi:hypothetical protein
VHLRRRCGVAQRAHESSDLRGISYRGPSYRDADGLLLRYLSYVILSHVWVLTRVRFLSEVPGVITRELLFVLDERGDDANGRELEPDRGLAASARPPAGDWVGRCRAHDRNLRTLADESPDDSQWRHFAAFAASRTSSCVKTA